MIQLYLLNHIFIFFHFPLKVIILTWRTVSFISALIYFYTRYSQNVCHQFVCFYIYAIHVIWFTQNFCTCNIKGLYLFYIIDVTCMAAIWYGLISPMAVCVLFFWFDLLHSASLCDCSTFFLFSTVLPHVTVFLVSVLIFNYWKNLTRDCGGAQIQCQSRLLHRFPCSIQWRILNSAMLAGVIDVLLDCCRMFQSVDKIKFSFVIKINQLRLVLLPP